MRRTKLLGIGIALAGVVGAVLLAIEIGLIPVALAAPPSTWIGTATFDDTFPDAKITSDGGGEYTDCRLDDGEDPPEGEDEVEIDKDGKDQLTRLSVICGRHCRTCGGNSQRRVSLNLQGGASQVESGSTEEELLNAIIGANLEQAHVRIQVWPVGKNLWRMIVQFVSDPDLTWKKLTDPISEGGWEIGEAELANHRFWSGLDCNMAAEGNTAAEDDNTLDCALEYQDVEFGPSSSNSWTISPSGQAELYVLKKKGKKGAVWEAEVLATYESLPFQITVIADEELGAAKPAEPPASPSTWGQVKDQIR